jgi:hypothetical protein
MGELNMHPRRFIFFPWWGEDGNFYLVFSSCSQPIPNLFFTMFPKFPMYFSQVFPKTPHFIPSFASIFPRVAISNL